MSYMSDLKKVRAEGISIWKLAVANEVDYFFSSKYEEEQLEGICEFVYDWVMDSDDASPADVCKALECLFEDEEITIDDLTSHISAVIQKVNSII